MILLVVSLKYGIIYLCFSILAYNICDYLITLFFVKKVFSTSLFEQIKWMKDIILLDIGLIALTVFGIYLFKEEYTLQLFVRLPLCIFIYVIFASFTNEGKKIKKKICTKCHF